MNTYRLRFLVEGRIEGAQQFQAEDDDAALAFMALQRRGRAATLSGTGGLIRSCGSEVPPVRSGPQSTSEDIAGAYSVDHK